MKPNRLTYHEAGHDLAVDRLGGFVTLCEIGARGGRTKWRGLSLLGNLTAVVAGHEAERLLVPADADPAGSARDIAKAAEIAFRIVRLGERAKLAALGLDEPDEKMLARYSVRAEKLVAAAEAKAARLLAENVGALRLVAARLAKDGAIDGETVAALVREAASK